MPNKVPAAHPPLVLLHGLRGSPIGLKTIADDLQQAGYTVFSPAVPPFGGAPELPDYTLKNYADYFAQYIKANHLKNAIFIGHSMGSIVVGALASYYPELINSKIVLLSPISNKPAKPFRWLANLTAVLPSGLIDLVTTLFLFTPRSRTSLKQTLAATHACSNDHPPKKSAVKQATKFSSATSLKDTKFTKTVLIVAGNHDRLVRLKYTRSLADSLSAKLKVLPATGHLHNYERPHETAQAIIEFLN